MGILEFSVVSRLCFFGLVFDAEAFSQDDTGYGNLLPRFSTKKPQTLIKP